MPHSRQIHFFATRSDLVPGLEEAEKKLQLKYALCELYYGPVFQQYISLLEWPGLGKNTTGDHISGPQFLIVPRNSTINVESVRRVAKSDETRTVKTKAFTQYLEKLDPQNVKEPTSEPEFRFSVNQKLNPDSITLLPGGIYENQRVLVCGHIGTASAELGSQNLYKSFVKILTGDFKRIGSYRVGPEAIRLMDEGFRMVTISIKSPREYDLSRS